MTLEYITHQIFAPDLGHRSRLAMLRQRQFTVPVFHYNEQGHSRNLSHVPGTWYVYGADPWAPGQVMLTVGPTRTPPVQPPQPGTPVASPAA